MEVSWSSTCARAPEAMHTGGPRPCPVPSQTIAPTSADRPSHRARRLAQSKRKQKSIWRGGEGRGGEGRGDGC